MSEHSPAHTLARVHTWALTQHRPAALVLRSAHPPGPSGVLSLLHTREPLHKRFHTLKNNTHGLWHTGPENSRSGHAGLSPPEPCPEHSTCAHSGTHTYRRGMSHIVCTLGLGPNWARHLLASAILTSCPQAHTHGDTLVQGLPHCSDRAWPWCPLNSQKMSRPWRILTAQGREPTHFLGSLTV